MCKQYNVYNNRYCWGLRWPSGLHIGLSHRRWWLNPWLWPLCKHLFIELLKQWSLCLPTVNTVYLYLTTVCKRSADRGINPRGHYVRVSCAYTVTTALWSQYVPIGYHVQHSTSLLGSMRKRWSKPKSKFVYLHYTIYTQLLAVCPPQMA